MGANKDNNESNKSLSWAEMAVSGLSSCNYDYVITKIGDTKIIDSSKKNDETHFEGESQGKSQGALNKNMKKKKKRKWNRKPKNNKNK